MNSCHRFRTSYRVSSVNAGDNTYHLRRAFGQLSMMTHLSNQAMLSALLTDSVDIERAVNILRTYNAEAVKMLLGLHPSLLIEFAIQLHVLYVDAFGEGLTHHELDCLELAKTFLEEEQLLARLPFGETIESYDTEQMQKAIQKAQETLPVFFNKLKDKNLQGCRFSVKVCFVDGDISEHLWVTDIKVRMKGVRGVVVNVPKYLTKPRYHQSIIFRQDQVTDWTIEKDGMLVDGGHTNSALSH